MQEIIRKRVFDLWFFEISFVKYEYNVEFWKMIWGATEDKPTSLFFDQMGSKACEI